jgi:hypothetical protein
MACPSSNDGRRGGRPFRRGGRDAWLRPSWWRTVGCCWKRRCSRTCALQPTSSPANCDARATTPSGGHGLVARPGASQPSSNTQGRLTLAQGSDVVTYRYDRPNAPLLTSFRLPARQQHHQATHRRHRAGPDRPAHAEGHCIQRRLATRRLGAAGLPQALCADGSQDCWPTLALTDAVVTITGQAVSDATVSRTVTSRVRLRNDGVTFNVSATQVCP